MRMLLFFAVHVSICEGHARAQISAVDGQIVVTSSNKRDETYKNRFTHSELSIAVVCVLSMSLCAKHFGEERKNHHQDLKAYPVQ